MSTKKDTSSETLYGALVKLRGVLSNPEKNSINPHYKSKYCKLEDLIQHVREPLSSHGLTFVQNIVNEEKSVMAQTTIIHESGETLTLDGPAVLLDKFTPQGVGAACTYAKRYGICSAFGIESDEDDDANAAEDDFADLDVTQHPSERKEREVTVIGKSMGGAPIETEEHAVMFKDAFTLHCDGHATNRAELKALMDKHKPDIEDCRMLFPEVGDKITAYIQTKVKSFKA